ncbi:hypothetical protein BJ165DRAFT_1341580 [Panaeolus papilionaceus]|nr:hypothetical protein BJ165DRAFT_1341580 [Panaeolus papilionaceus]
MPSYLITGASRGIGLSIVEVLLKQDDTFVIATARNVAGAAELNALTTKFGKDRLALLPLDVSSQESIDAAVKQAGAILPKGLDNLILNAGVHHQPLCSFDDIDFDKLADELRFNTEYPIRTVRSFLPLIRAGEGKKITFMTSELGSVEMAGILPGLTNAYSISKAAFNMVARKYGGLLKFEGINVVVLHPGWVKTEIGSGIEGWMATYAPQIKQMTPEESATGCVKVIQSAKLDDATSFWNDKGEKKPW